MTAPARRTILALGLFSGLLILPLAAQMPQTVTTQAAPAPKAKKPVVKKKKAPVAPLQSGGLVAPANTVQVPANDTNTLVEDIIARVDNKIITSDDMANAELEMKAELQQDANGAPVTEAQIDAASKDLLRDLIDQQLLLEKADALGLNADTDVVLRLDSIRQQQHLASMEDLQKYVESQGESYEDFKQNIKNGILTQKVIEQDVAPRISISEADMLKYYNTHKADFVRQNEVALSEIFISTAGRTGDDLTKLQTLAKEVQQRAAAGEDFTQLVTRYSNSDSASNGGQLGFFKKGQLAPNLEKDVFNLPVNGVTPVEKVSNGLLILKVDAIHHAGQESFAEAKDEVENAIYQQDLGPELRHYLSNLRDQAYIRIKPGYVDTGMSESAGVNLERFERVLPTDLPKDTGDKSGGTKITGGGGGD